MKNGHLFVLTYEMDESSRLLSHQAGVVNQLATIFDKITVLTGKVGVYSAPMNVKIYSSEWQQGKRIKSSIKFMSIFLKIISQNKFNAIFSHMTSAQSALVAPITKIYRIKHYLWYTHTSNNLSLKFCALLTDGILTATTGSCPIKGSKVHVIGHSIDTQMFNKKKDYTFPLNKFVHIGRFDPIKNIEKILETICGLKLIHKDILFTNFGDPSSEAGIKYQRRIVKEYSDKKFLDYITFRDSLNRNDVSGILKSKDAFIHACDAGLDKALLEATLTGLPVVTINKQYLEIFGRSSKNDNFTGNQLLIEALALQELSESSLRIELNRRYELALLHADLKVWAIKVKEIIES